ncbi:hypothetical protein V6N13_033587 [Hibiscus sabdariffa]|uniref:Uncharacterized protein n=1 Tax=Hibiscus sabdariffa TaxID=183260 RepID=A0ABR2FA11_9ROSI
MDLPQEQETKCLQREYSPVNICSIDSGEPQHVHEELMARPHWWRSKSRVSFTDREMGTQVPSAKVPPIIECRASIAEEMVSEWCREERKEEESIPVTCGGHEVLKQWVAYRSRRVQDVVAKGDEL